MKHARMFSMPPGHAAAIAAVILACSSGVWAVAQSGERSAVTRPAIRSVAPRGSLLPTEQATVDLFEKARASVVYISTQTQVMDRWTRNVFNVPRGTGSGFIWDSLGHIVTPRRRRCV